MWTSHEVKLCRTETITVINIIQDFFETVTPFSVVIPASLDI